MTLPVDRGYAVIASHADGTSTVQVCTGIERGQPQAVYAKHARVSRVRIDPQVRLVRGASYRYTTQVVEVFTYDGAVCVKLPSRSLV
jgi:hypothetical protein